MEVGGILSIKFATASKTSQPIRMENVSRKTHVSLTLAHMTEYVKTIPGRLFAAVRFLMLTFQNGNSMQLAKAQMLQVLRIDRV